MDLFKLFGTIAVDNTDANRALKETQTVAKQTGNAFGDAATSAEASSGRFGNAMKKIGKGAAAVGKTVAAGIGLASVAVAAIGKQAIQAYADYEQLIGGVETLFKNSSGIVQEYAANAYKTAGLSANQYMETVTSFSASLLQSLDGDTKKAAAYADLAVTDMSDNANKMGTDMTMIQNAYQGFAKQNFTMLDNLKLGYGGTKEEMERLLEDAHKLDSSITPDVSDFGNVVKAIHAVQTEMGITGTTAKEASSTISGSLNSMKGAWQNVLIGLTDDSQNFEGLIDNLFTTVSNFADNLMPRLTQVLSGVGKLITQLAPKLIPMISELIGELLPHVIQGAKDLLQAIVNAMPDLVRMLLDALPSLIQGILEIVNVIIDQLPMIIEMLLKALIDLLPQLISGIVNLVVTICNNIDRIVQPIIDNVPTLILTLVKSLMDNLPLLLEGIINLVVSIAEQTPVIIQSIVDMLPQLIEMILTALLKCLPQILAGIGKIVWGIVKSLPQILGSLVEGIVNIFKGIWGAIKNVFSLNEVGNWFKNVFSKAKDAIFNAWNNVKQKFSDIWNGIKNVFSNVGNWFKDTFNKAKENAVNAWNNIKQKFSEKWNNIKNAFSNVGSWFKDTFSKAKDGAVNAWGNVKQKFTDVKNKIVGAFADIKEKLSAPFKKAGDAIKGVVDKIKEWFANIKIKLPHFKIDGKFSLSPLQVPKLKIDWYAKAMQNPMIMNKPTIFGYNPLSGNFMGGGEAGSEMVGGTNTVMRMIRDAVLEQNNGMTSYLQQLVEILADYFPQVLTNMDRSFVFNDGTVAAHLAPAMNVELGRIKGRKDRGR